MIQQGIRSISISSPQQENEGDINLDSAQWRDTLIGDLSLKVQHYLAESSLYDSAKRILLDLRNTQGYEAAGIKKDGSNGDARVNEIAETDPQLQDKRAEADRLEEEINELNAQNRFANSTLSQEKKNQIQVEAKAIGALREIDNAHQARYDANIQTITEITTGKLQDEDAIEEKTRRHNMAVKTQQQSYRVLKHIYKLDQPTAAMQGEWFRRYAEPLYTNALQAYFSTESNNRRQALSLLMFGQIQMGISSSDLLDIRLQGGSVEDQVREALQRTNLVEMKKLAEEANFYVEDQVGLQRNPQVWK